MKQDESNNLLSNQMIVVVGTVVIAVVILVGIWIVHDGNSGPSSTPEATEVAGPEEWPTVGPTFTPSSTFTPVGPVDTPTVTPPPTSTPTSTSTPTATSTPTPSPTPSPTPRVIDIQELGHLTSVEFTGVTVVELEKERAIANPLGFGPEGVPVGVDRILMEAVGKIKFGIDLKQVKQSDVIVDGNEVSVTLPRAEVTGVELLPDQTKIHAAEKSWLLSETEGMEIEALNKGKSQLENWAKGQGKLTSIAEKLAKLQLEGFLYSLGFDKVEISFKGQGI